MVLVVLSLAMLQPPHPLTPTNSQFSGDLRDQETTHHALKLGNFPAVSGGLKRDTVYKTIQFTSKCQNDHGGSSLNVNITGPGVNISWVMFIQADTGSLTVVWLL